MALNIEAKSGPSSTIKTEIARRSADYHPSIWGDKFLAYNSSDHGKTDADTLKKLQRLEEEVKKMLVEAVDEPKKQLNLIDNIQRLGVSYHFENEIDSALQHMSDIYREYCTENDALHSIALCFRLLRQQGHNVSSDVFRKFLDNEGKFKEYLLTDARGMLSLYEATHHRIQEEDILEEALSFTASGLEHLKSSLSNPLADEITHALKCPIRKNLNRLGARHYISIYTKHDSHDKLVLEFSKLDFNLLQKMYQQELCNITRWWKDLDFSKKLPFARDRVVECYFWILGVYFEPQYQIARRFLTKVIMIASVVDDIYDLYGTFEELLLFTDAIERWNTNSLDELPEYMRVCYQAIIDIYTEMEEEMGNAAGGSLSYRFDVAKNSFKRLAKAYLDEAKWYREDYFPTTEEYMNVAIVSSGYGTMATNSFVGMGDEATREAFDWVSNDPLIVRASSLIARLCDDMTGHEFEQKKGDIPSAVECYMNQYGAKKQDAYAELQKRVTAAWKDVNQECLRPTPFPMSLLTRIDNLTRAINILYDGDDGYTHSSRRTKDFITSVLVDSLP